MSKKDNFSQAMFEMFGLGKAPTETEEEADGLENFVPAEESKQDADLTADFASMGLTDEFDASEDVSSYVEPEPYASPAPSSVPVSEPAPAAAAAPVSEPARVADPVVERPQPPRRANCTYFAAGTSMEGTLRSDSDVEICGDFKGEIASDGKVTIHANTNSSIAAAELVLIDCNLVGDSMVTGDVSINEKSAVAGNIRAANLACSGVIKGNLNIAGNITLGETAQILGDIKTGTLAMSRGAKVSGKIDMDNT